MFPRERQCDRHSSKDEERTLKDLGVSGSKELKVSSDVIRCNEGLTLETTSASLFSYGGNFIFINLFDQ